LRKPSVFDNDETIQNYVRAGKGRLVQGDALVKDDVKRGWTAAQGDDNKSVDFLVFTVGKLHYFSLALVRSHAYRSTGGTPYFKLTKGFVISPPNLVTQSLLNCLETLPSPHPNIIAISSAGITRIGHKKLPLMLKPLYSYLLAVMHADKCGVEEVLAYCAGWEWKTEDSPGAEVLGGDWKASGDLPAPGSLKSVVVIRPALLTDGACRADTWEPSSMSGGPYKAKEGDLAGRWTVSRMDVAHFVVEEVVRRWDQWEGKRVSIAY
jgi:hypothetical protein